eukprot:gene21188-21991_t
MKALMGLLAHTRGKVILRGQDISAAQPHRIARMGMGYVPEERRIFSDLSVLQNLEVGRQPPRIDAVNWSPEKLFRLFPNLGEMPHRVAPLIVAQMAQMILQLKHAGMSILLSEQNFHFAAQVSDRAYVLENGHVRHQASMAQLATNETVRRTYLEL